MFQAAGAAAFGPSQAIGNRQAWTGCCPAFCPVVLAGNPARASVLRAAVSRRQLPDDDRRAHRARHCPECHGWHRGARHVHCPIPRVRWVAGRCRQWPACLLGRIPAAAGKRTDHVNARSAPIAGCGGGPGIVWPGPWIERCCRPDRGGPDDRDSRAHGFRSLSARARRRAVPARPPGSGQLRLSARARRARHTAARPR